MKPVLERTFIDDIKRLIEDARLNTYAAINAVMLETYWNIGKRIVEQAAWQEPCGIWNAVIEGAFRRTVRGIRQRLLGSQFAKLQAILSIFSP